ncbi:bifunctional demethylmenaquinone methyltransferase/2-methoxy-6-polyprenyl-1,4-benzoquinol methylase UbiE [Helicobacter sp. 11S02629-2]|uniref:bifunctional demethylmenaquinone methyltransferase/2-methoxy-6-polyprenyl-1,4-benzoquinol methylase UbiE n=1 Tax=Helicobacter sp. 11S02629-2 TaxID=1476195 RepID=UPI000BA78853|nr:bifunctional demethylmenaquinone methyltransferase/2-methoxy-6-polyprenyl-1,4-benzoquinol methylase UbiE [Helicobacter sp. 11S02629-2]PAF45494.1 bifunctional demethylmenaquinone methyltransferase/2-methoxy-6-polyprenyl-1,4-benzoquinol methylase [Helicobacter sp. 11S02629-2]
MKKDTKSQKQQDIINMFDDIAPTYDKANRLLSLGIDVSWRKEACKEAFLALENRHVDIADVACGTGDMLIHWQESAILHNIEIKSINGFDPSSGMLDIAKKKIPSMESNLHIASATNIPLPDNSVDIVSIAYGLRNVVDRKDALKEFHRVLKPNGVVVILEFASQKKFNLLTYPMYLYTKYALPIIGGLISKNFKAYKYLPASIDSFITKEGLSEELLASGMESVFVKSYSGISALVIAKKT